MPHASDIVNLTVQHGTRLMLKHILCHHDKFILRLIAYGSHHISRSNIKSEHQWLFHVFSVAHLQYLLLIFHICDCQINLPYGIFHRSIIIDHHFTVFPVNRFL